MWLFYQLDRNNVLAFPPPPSKTLLDVLSVFYECNRHWMVGERGGFLNLLSNNWKCRRCFFQDCSSRGVFNKIDCFYSHLGLCTCNNNIFLTKDASFAIFLFPRIYIYTRKFIIQRPKLLVVNIYIYFCSSVFQRFFTKFSKGIDWKLFSLTRW